MLEDVERIEVISGPGATLWGANAVNGVINVITRTARRHAGALLPWPAAAIASRGVGVRYGGDARRRATSASTRKHARAGRTRADAAGAARRRRLGREPGRLPRRLERTATAASRCRATPTAARPEHARLPGAVRPARSRSPGCNLLGRWTRQLDGGSDAARAGVLRPHRARRRPAVTSPKSTSSTSSSSTACRSAAHRCSGAAAIATRRRRRSRARSSASFRRSATSTGRTCSCRTRSSSRATLRRSPSASKFEHNDYTGTESCRARASPGSRRRPQLLWGARVARGARAGAARSRHSSAAGNPPFIIAGGPNFVSEVANVLRARLSRAAASRTVAIRSPRSTTTGTSCAAASCRPRSGAEQDRRRHLRRRGVGRLAGRAALAPERRLHHAAQGPALQARAAAIRSGPARSATTRSTSGCCAPRSTLAARHESRRRPCGASARCPNPARAGVHRARPALWLARARRARAVAHRAQPARRRPPEFGAAPGRSVIARSVLLHAEVGLVNRLPGCAWSRRAIVLLASLAVCAARHQRGLGAGRRRTGEYQVKAAFVFKFLNYVDWPPEPDRRTPAAHRGDRGARVGR